MSVKGFLQWLRLRSKEQQLRSFAVGMNSTVDVTKDLHVLFLDFDVDDLGMVRESVKELQVFWRLSDCDIFSTKHGFHAFFFNDVMPYGRVKLIIEFARYVDPMFKYIARFHDHKTIRVAGKYKESDIRYAETIKGVRVPSAFELEVGAMKRSEHSMLREQFREGFA